MWVVVALSGLLTGSTLADQLKPAGIQNTIQKSLEPKKTEKPDWEAQVLVPLKAKQAAQAAREEQERLASQVAVQTAPAQAYALPSGDAKAFIYMHESGNNPGAVNASSGACGLGQALPCSKMPCSLSDYACQDNFFTQYMLNRYGSWENAMAFWLSHNWW